MIGLSRNVDAYLLGDSASGPLSLEMSSGGRMAYGPAAAVQKFLIFFLTKKGSVSTDPDYGTSFMNQLTTGQLRNEAEISMAFTQAAADTLSYLASIRTDDHDTDEEIVAVEVGDISITATTVTISARLHLLSASTITFVAPFELS